jgi:hypothetical protein
MEQKCYLLAQLELMAYWFCINQEKQRSSFVDLSSCAAP